MTLLLDSIAPDTRRSTDATARPAGARRLDAPVNVLVLAGLWFGYAAVRDLTTSTQHVALGNAGRLLDVESSLGIDIELGIQSAIEWPAAFVAANAYYLVHFPLTLTVMVLTFARRRTTIFPVLRNSLVACTTTALVIHLIVPMAPPRMLSGFVDAGLEFGPDPYAIAGSDNANQFAAMPSMHVAWAILCGYAIWHLSASRVVRFVGVAHPLMTSLVVIVTGHHFVSDVAIGAGLSAVFLASAAGFARSRTESSNAQAARRRARRILLPKRLHWPSHRTGASTMYPINPNFHLVIHEQRRHRLEASAAHHRSLRRTQWRHRTSTMQRPSTTTY